MQEDANANRQDILPGGGYVIAPLGPEGHQSRSLVRHMITADWKVWQTCFQPSSEQDVTLRVLERIAGDVMTIFSSDSMMLSLLIIHI